VSNENLIPDEEPNPALRSKVLEAVAVAIEQETAELEPLATIGRNRLTQSERQDQSILNGTRQYWRAATFMMIAGLVVVLYFWAASVEKGNTISILALGRNTEAQLEELIGPTVKDFLFDPAAKPVRFRPAAGSNTAALLVREGTSEAFLVIDGLSASQNETYTLTARHAGGIETVHRFDSNGRLWGTKIELSKLVVRAQNVTWEISDVNGVLLASI
jgi:hypothetical protein